VDSSVFLITPPFTQLNTPYPATAYLKGFLNTKKIRTEQLDLGIETILRVFCKTGLTSLFQHIRTLGAELSANSARILALEQEYLNTIDHVIGFLQGKSPTLAYSISKRKFLPEASRFSNMDQLNWDTGSF
jgi:hypothetical protein